MIIGYARVSTQEQNLDLQMDDLLKAGCNRIFKEHISGKNTQRPELQKMISMLRPGDNFKLLPILDNNYLIESGSGTCALSWKQPLLKR